MNKCIFTTTKVVVCIALSSHYRAIWFNNNKWGDPVLIIITKTEMWVQILPLDREFRTKSDASHYTLLLLSSHYILEPMWLVLSRTPSCSIHHFLLYWTPFIGVSDIVARILPWPINYIPQGSNIWHFQSFFRGPIPYPSCVRFIKKKYHLPEASRLVGKGSSLVVSVRLSSVVSRGNGVVFTVTLVISMSSE